MKIYNVVFNWATEDDSNTEINSYNSYEAAKNAFLTIIKDEMNPDVSWVGDAFDENGQYDRHRYELVSNAPFDDNRERELFWCLTDVFSACIDEVYLKICEAK